jgi:adenylate cyclase
VTDDDTGAEVDPGLEPLERELLGGSRQYTRREVAERADVTIENARQLWRALGFADVDDDTKRAFTDRDVEALRTVRLLMDKGIIDEDTQVAMTRAMGQSLGRLAEWQVSAITSSLTDPDGPGQGDPVKAARELVPVMETLIGYVWRRHLAATAGRLLALAGGEVDGTLAVGFADLVGFTSLTRHVDEEELGKLVERFEQVANDVVATHGGRVIKTVGDEVMFAADAPDVAAEIALGLLEQAAAADLPELRVGLACGAVLARLGDLYGEPVNLASRLTTAARPGSILVDREFGAAIENDERYVLRRVPPRPVRGYALLQPMRLRRAPGAEDAAGGPT